MTSGINVQNPDSENGGTAGMIRDIFRQATEWVDPFIPSSNVRVLIHRVGTPVLVQLAEQVILLRQRPASLAEDTPLATKKK